jgi:Reverse transcriptase (RNA-dependent DNA polymerase)
VDDIIVIGNNSAAIHDLITALYSQFSLKDLDTVNYFLVLEVTTMDIGLHLSQTKYLQSILEKTGTSGAKPRHTPLQVGVQLSKFDSSPLSDPILYSTIVDMLQYATLTRPDLTFLVNKVSQFFA